MINEMNPAIMKMPAPSTTQISQPAKTVQPMSFNQFNLMLQNDVHQKNSRNGCITTEQSFENSDIQMRSNCQHSSQGNEMDNAAKDIAAICSWACDARSSDFRRSSLNSASMV